MKKYKDLLEEHTQSYMCLRFHEHKGPTKELRVPTFWDDTTKSWIGCLKTTRSGSLISANGKDSFSLQNNFIRVLNDLLEKNEELSQEIYDMFEIIKE